MAADAISIIVNTALRHDERPVTKGSPPNEECGWHVASAMCRPGAHAIA